VIISSAAGAGATVNCGRNVTDGSICSFGNIVGSKYIINNNIGEGEEQKEQQR